MTERLISNPIFWPAFSLLVQSALFLGAQRVGRRKAFLAGIYHTLYSHGDVVLCELKTAS